LDVADLSTEDLYENAPCGYLSATPDGTIVRVNGTFLRWTGYTREQLVGVKRFQQLLSPGGRIYHETHYAPLLRMQGSVREIAVDVVTADHRRLPVLVNSVLVTDEAGEPQLVRTTVLDARERNAYERELRAARDRERRARENIERLQEQTQAISHTLQQSLLASAPPFDPRYSIATLYQPAGGEELEVGGDWHDAFKLGHDRVGVVVGDVVGRGLVAATAMGQLRSAVRALALTGIGPRAVIGYLDSFVEQVEPAQFATVVYAEIDPGSGMVTVAAAGHLPPVVVTPAGAELFLGGRSTPLGVSTAAAPRTEATFELAPGHQLVLYTDVLVERRSESLDVGLERLLAAAPTAAGPDSLARALEEDGRGDDDVCVLVFTRLG
jgi:sigma-B regulation protein RsbU (phosphoserine phosphatase)